MIKNIIKNVHDRHAANSEYNSEPVKIVKIYMPKGAQKPGKKKKYNFFNKNKIKLNLFEIKDKVVICADWICSEHTTMDEAWQTAPTQSCYVIDFEKGKVWIPTIDRYNNWWGDWELASPRKTGELLERYKEANPVKFDYEKIKRRTEDALSKIKDNAVILEMANRLKIKLR